MKALVTGVAGFIGSTLAKQLLSDGHEVIGIDALTDYYEVSIKRHNLAGIGRERFTFHHGDLNGLDLDDLLSGVDWVFHQAGQPGVRMSWGEDFAIYVRENVLATQRLLEAARRAPSLQRLVYASSSSVYGNADTYPTPETARTQPLSPYGVTKLAAEQLCSLYAANFGLPTVSLRYFTVYGPGQRTDMAFTRFVRAAVLDEVDHDLWHRRSDPGLHLCRRHRAGQHRRRLDPRGAQRIGLQRRRWVKRLHERHAGHHRDAERTDTQGRLHRTRSR